MFGSDSLSGFNPRLRSRDRARPGRRRARRRLQLAAEVLRLEERWMLSTAPNQIPPNQVTKAVPLSDIIWNGGPPMPGAPGITNPTPPPGKLSFPSPSAAGAMKTITLTNNDPEQIYPFIRGENRGQDPNATSPNKFYDPQDAEGQGYREYIGYQTSEGTFIGLPAGASITFQVPLVLWDGDNMYLASDPNYLTSDALPYKNVYNYDQNAKISIAAYTGQDSTEWVTKASNYPAGATPAVVFYRSPTPRTVLPAAPAQLVEWTFRDPYLMQFITDPLQTFPLINYDVSYVNNLTAPVAIEASHVPITVGDRLSTTTPPTYYGYQDYGWNPTNLDTATFGPPIGQFVGNTGDAAIRDYFGGKGWPEYYNPEKSDVVIPSGANLFLNSPLTDQRSPYDQNYYLLASTSNGAGPISLASLGAVKAGGNKIHFAANYRAQLQALKDQFGPKRPLDVIASKGDYAPGTKVTDIDPEALTVTVNRTQSGTTKGGVYDFVRPVDDYAVTDITKLWYSWAKYYVDINENFQAETARAAYNPPADTTKPQNEITLTSAPGRGEPLAVGMTVKGRGIRQNTTILSIEDPQGNPIGSAKEKGDKIFLSLLPDRTKIQPREVYTFGKPTPIKYANLVKTYDLKFGAQPPTRRSAAGRLHDAGQGSPARGHAPIVTGAARGASPFARKLQTQAQKEQARLFAGSVYAAMDAQAPVVQPIQGLPNSAALVGQVIQFYAKLPTDGQPGGKNLTGQVRDVVKSILRGVWNFIAVPNQSDWYPNPATPTPNAEVDNKPAKFGVYNLDPYVWFVHEVQKMSGYAFSVDDDVANPAAPGPVLAPDKTTNHDPSDLQVAFGGIKGFGNPNEWFPTIPWGEIDTTATISKVGGDGIYKDDYMITFTNPNDDPTKDPQTLFEQINNPGPGQVGAYVSSSSPGYIPRGTTLIFKGPNGADKPQIVLLPPKGTEIKATDTPIPIMITGTLPSQ
jgi:hypothetical protein